MLKKFLWLFAATALFGLASCGGGTSSSSTTTIAQESKEWRSEKAQASDYAPVVQSLYIAYFGRPADPTGLSNFENALIASGVSPDIQSVANAYSTNSAVQSLINSFGSSKESQTLYGGGTPTSFVTAVFNNVLGRQPLAAGLNYWSSAITSGGLSQGDAALSIMAGGLTNTTPQGLLDAQLINNRLTVASYFTAQVSNAGAVSLYAGPAAAANARSMLSAVTASTNTTAYQSVIDQTVAAFAGIITTITGTGRSGPVSNNVPAVSAALGLPYGVAVDSSGNIFIADFGDGRIFEVTAKTSLITSVAGSGPTGCEGYAGDNGPATAAEFCNILAVAVDNSGNIYVVDAGNHVIREISAVTGIIKTVAGTAGIDSGGPGGYSGDNGSATQAQIGIPYGVAIDAAGNIYIADTNNNAIRKVTVATGIITTIAGNGVSGYSGDNGPASNATFNSPHGVAVDASGNVYVADTGNNVVRKISAATGVISVVAGGAAGGRPYSGDNGPATSANLDLPFGVAVDKSGNIYIADYYNSRIRKVTANTGIITTVAGNGGNTPYVSNIGDNGPATDAQVGFPYGVAIDASGNIYIADEGDNRIRKVSY